jgi:CRISPR-associated protein Csm4
MRLYRLRLFPTSTWRTPWEADTVFGSLCWACARKYGGARLREEIVEPSLEGEPPFVVSDAFPSGWMPAPVVLRQGSSLEQYRRLASSGLTDATKRVRKARWLSEGGFRMVQRGELPAVEEFAIHEPIEAFGEINNQIGRESNTTSSGGELFVSDSWALSSQNLQKGMTIFVRTDESYSSRLVELFAELGKSGFGADVSTGKGEFRPGGGLEPCSELEEVENSDASIVLSTFQPARKDPCDGFWEAIVKRGKLGPDFGLANVFKRPMIMLRPGTVLLARRDWFGRALAMPEFLAPDVVSELESVQAHVLHPAFGLAVPAKVGWR